MIFPAAMGGLAVGLITGRRELVAAITGGVIAVAIALAWDPSVGDHRRRRARAAGGHGGAPGPGERQREDQLASGPEPRTTTTRPRRTAATRRMSVVLVPLALLMGLVTYPFRAVPMLAPGFDRLPANVRLYLRLVGPAVLAALAATNTMVAKDASGAPAFHVGLEWVAVGLCLVIVGLRKSLLLGLLVAAGLMAVARAGGWAPLP